MTHPILYEINTRCWLRELSEKLGEAVTLANVPESEFAQWQKLGFTHIWLMGVWTTGPLSRAEALKHPGLRSEYDRVLPGWTETDVGGSPYAIADYQVPQGLGGESGLKKFRERLHACGLKLVLDFVPNHLGLDHRWIYERPELFVQRSEQIPDAVQLETRLGKRWFAHGKDPYFPGWTDTVQLDYRLPETREAMTELLGSIAETCDGVRCDMAMLTLENVFASTWQHVPLLSNPPRNANSKSQIANSRGQTSNERRASSDSQSSIANSQVSKDDFWAETIPEIRASHPNFLFLAEAYWGLEGRLQLLDFDYTYDKTLYDRIVSRDTPSLHLTYSSPQFVSASAHFLENHDEPRIASILSAEEQRAAALIILGSPGMRFLNEGQLTGALIKVPVQLVRRSKEAIQPEIQLLYEKLLSAVKESSVSKGNGRILVPRTAWPDNATERNFFIAQWQTDSNPGSFDLVVVNVAPQRSQCYAPLQIPNLSKSKWQMRDVLGSEVYERAGEDLDKRGVYLDVPAHAAQLFRFTSLPSDRNVPA